MALTSTAILVINADSREALKNITKTRQELETIPETRTVKAVFDSKNFTKEARKLAQTIDILSVSTSGLDTKFKKNEIAARQFEGLFKSLSITLKGVEDSFKSSAVALDKTGKSTKSSEKIRKEISELSKETKVFRDNINTTFNSLQRELEESGQNSENLKKVRKEVDQLLATAGRGSGIGGFLNKFIGNVPPSEIRKVFTVFKEGFQQASVQATKITENLKLDLGKSEVKGASALGEKVSTELKKVTQKPIDAGPILNPFQRLSSVVKSVGKDFSKLRSEAKKTSSEVEKSSRATDRKEDKNATNKSIVDSQKAFRKAKKEIAKSVRELDQEFNKIGISTGGLEKKFKKLQFQAESDIFKAFRNSGGSLAAVDQAVKKAIKTQEDFARSVSFSKQQLASLSSKSITFDISAPSQALPDKLNLGLDAEESVRTLRKSIDRELSILSNEAGIKVRTVTRTIGRVFNQLFETQVVQKFEREAAKKLRTRVSEAFRKGVGDSGKETLKSVFKDSFGGKELSRALEQEVESTFGKEVFFRRIFAKVFSKGFQLGQIGFSLGNFGEFLVKSFQVSTKKIVAPVAATITSLFIAAGNIVGPRTSVVLGGISRFVSVGLIKAIDGGFTLARKIINSKVGALVGALFQSISVAFFRTLKKFVSSTLAATGRALRGFFSSIRNIFSRGFGGGGGGGGGAGGALNFKALFSVGGIAVATRLAGSLQEAILEVSTITGLMGASLRKTTKDVIDFSNEFGKSATEVGRSLFGISSAGFRGNEALVVLRSALTAAKGGITTTDVAANAIVRTLRAFGKGSKDAGKVADILFNTVKRGITSFPVLAQQITRVTSLASSAKVPFKQVGAILANLTRNGQTTEQAITGLAQILKAVIAPVSEGKNAIGDLSKILSEENVRKKGLIPALQQIAPEILKNKEGFKKFFGDVQALKSALVVAQSVVRNPIGKGSLAEDLALIDKAGSSMEASAIVSAGFNDQLKVFLTRFTNIVTNVGQFFLPSAQSFLSIVNEALNKIAKITNTSGIGSFLAKIANAAKDVTNSLSDVFVGAFSFFSEKAIAIGVPFLKGLGAALSAISANIFNEVKRGIASILFSLASAVKGKTILGRLEGTFSDAAIVLANRSNNYVNVLDAFTTEIQKAALKQKDSQTSLESNVLNPLKKLGTSIKVAVGEIIDTSGQSLEAQQKKLKGLIKGLRSQLQEAVKAGRKEEEQILKQFIVEQQGRLEDIAKQAKNDPLKKLLKEKQEIINKLAIAKQSGNFSKIRSLLNELSANMIKINRINLETKEKEVKQVEKGVKTGKLNISQQESLREKIEKLFKSTQSSIAGISDLSSTLDRIFGKNIAAISKEFGVATDLVNLRKVTKSVIEARSAGFSERDVQKIIRVGATRDSSLLRQIFTVFAQQGSKELSQAKLKELGIEQKIIQFLDQLTALGATKEQRFRIFEGAISAETFSKLDKAESTERKEIDLIKKAFLQFKDLDEERKLQEELNKLQAEYNTLTGKSVGRLATLRKNIEQLQIDIENLKKEQESSDQVIASEQGF